MKKIFLFLMAAVLATACQNDDTDFSDYTNGTASSTSANVINIVYSSTSVAVTGDDNGYVTVNGTDVTVKTGTNTDSLLLPG